MIMDIEKDAVSLSGVQTDSRNESTSTGVATEGAIITLHDATGAIITTTTTTAGTAARPSFWTRLGVTPESFRRRTGEDEHNQLNQTLKGRHLSMIAIGGSIGAGLFVGSGKALSVGGPAALLIGFGLIGVVRLKRHMAELIHPSSRLTTFFSSDDVQRRLRTW
jgi:amino acid transporter